MIVDSQLSLSVHSVLAQAPAPDDQAGDPTYVLLMWGLALILFIVVGGAALLWFRRRMASKSAPAGGALSGGAFSPDALQELRAAGEITEEQFRALRQASLPLDIQAFIRPQGDKEPNSTLSPPSNGDDEDK